MQNVSSENHAAKLNLIEMVKDYGRKLTPGSVANFAHEQDDKIATLIRLVLSGVSLYVDFQERISIRGGGARWGCREVNRGPGQRQRLRTHSKCEATQSGSATL